MPAPPDPPPWLQVRRFACGEHAPVSLCWRGDELIDWVCGGDRWVDGVFVSARRGWGYGRFDGAVADPTGRWAVVHERTGTAALLLHDGEIVRELHRSPYHADDFLFPVCLFAGADGRVLLAHCPDHYGRIDLDDAATGERLTRGDGRRTIDFFHSQLAASPSGTGLLSAGWVWHPWDAVVWFDVAACLRDPARLDALDGAPHSRNVCLAEESSAAWLDDRHVVVGGSAEPEDPDEVAEVARDHPGPRLHPLGLAVYDVVAGRCVRDVALGYAPGAMMPVGPRHVVTFDDHPRLVDLDAGRVVHAWPHLRSGASVSSIVGNRTEPPPALALDPARHRFAIYVGNGGGDGGHGGGSGDGDGDGDGDAIEVITIDVTALP
ncbi:MAG: hypothetical protein H6708_13395 [Kofleriaceae bacterium]|nr:hypothetical protein [Myxococcales bacterium]MCB9561395.1 hypothetical protein [Kofleriaceae bacterium]